MKRGGIQDGVLPRYFSSEVPIFSTQAPVFTLSTCCKISISFIEVLEWVFYCNRHVLFYLCYIMKTNLVQYLKIFIS